MAQRISSRRADSRGRFLTITILADILYFIFFPSERPFVDNRPEAYPVDFFAKTYGPMQSDDKVWDKIDGKYGFQLIYFYRTI